MNKTAFLLLVVVFSIGTPSAFAYFPWDDPVLDIELAMPEKTAWKQNELTLFIESCDEVQKICYHKNRIPYVEMTILIEEIQENDTVFVECFDIKTGKTGLANIPIPINHLYKDHAHYKITITGEHDGNTDSIETDFWTQVKHY